MHKMHLLSSALHRQPGLCIVRRDAAPPGIHNIDPVDAPLPPVICHDALIPSLRALCNVICPDAFMLSSRMHPCSSPISNLSLKLTLSNLSPPSVRFKFSFSSLSSFSLSSFSLSSFSFPTLVNPSPVNPPLVYPHAVNYQGKA